MIKTIISRLTLILFTLILSACSSQLRNIKLATQIEPEVIPGKVFLPTKKNIANVGDDMLTAGEYSKESTGLRLETFNVAENTTTSVKHRMKVFDFSIPSGDYPLYSRVTDGSYYSAPAPFNGINGTRKGFGGLFVPIGASKATEFYWNWKPFKMVGLTAYQAKLTSPISGSISEPIVYLKDRKKSGPRATLTYLGVTAGQIRFVYKEFTKEGFARPAFTQEIILDYKSGGNYAYKNARFTVEKADSAQISFTLHQPL